MAEDSNRAEVVIGAKIDEATAAIAELKNRFGTFATDTTSSFDGLTSAGGKFTETVNQIKGAFVAVIAVLAGGKLFGGAIEETMTLTKEVNKLSIVLGISRADAQALATGLEMIGSSSEQYLNVVQRLTMRLNTQEASFNTMGVATRDSSGHLLDAQVVMQNVITHLDSMKAGTDRNLEATKLLGRSWQGALLFGRLNAEMLADIKAKQEALDMQITGQSVESMFKYMGAMVEAKEVFKAVALSAGQTMMPRLTDMAQWFASIGPSVVKMFNAALQTFIVIVDATKEVFVALVDEIVKGCKLSLEALLGTFGKEGGGYTAMQDFKAAMDLIQIAAIGMRAAFQTTFAVIDYLVDLTAKNLQWFGGVVKAALTPGGAIDMAWGVGMAKVEAAVAKGAANIKSINDKMKADIQNVVLGGNVPTKVADVQKPGGEGRYTGKAKGTVDTSEADLELALAKKSLETRIEFLKGEADAKRITEIEKINLVKEAEDKVYVLERGAMLDKVNLYKEGSKQYAAELNKVVLLDAQQGLDTMKNTVEMEAAKRKAAKESLAIEEEASKSRIALIDEGAKMENDYLDQQVAMGTITAAQKLTIERQYLQSVHDAEATEYARMAELYKGDEKEYQKHLDALAKFNATFQTTLQKNTNATLLAEQKEWQGMLQPIATAFDTTVKGIIMGTTTLQKGMSSIFQSILMEFLSMCTGMMVKWGALEAWKLATTKAGSVERAALEDSTTLASIFKKKLESLGFISVETAKTGAVIEGTAARTSVEEAGAVTSLATQAATAMKSIGTSIAGAFAGFVEFLAPVMGPYAIPAAIALSGVALAGAYKMMSASSGYDVPSGVSPITQLHPQEMVLPAPLANAVRGMASGSTSGGSMTINISAVDAAGVRKLFMDHGPALSDAIRRQARNFTPTVAR
jgi:hypothetical protein